MRVLGVITVARGSSGQVAKPLRHVAEQQITTRVLHGRSQFTGTGLRRSINRSLLPKRFFTVRQLEWVLLSQTHTLKETHSTIWMTIKNKIFDHSKREL